MSGPKRYQPPKAPTKEQVEAHRRTVLEIKEILNKLDDIQVGKQALSEEDAGAKNSAPPEVDLNDGKVVRLVFKLHGASDLEKLERKMEILLLEHGVKDYNLSRHIE